jgi:hypothetical protein
MTLTLAVPISAQSPPPQGPGRAANQAYATIKRNIVASAEKMPAAEFTFKPAPEVRSFGQILGHVANAGFGSCATLLTEANPNTANLEQQADKAGAAAALKTMFEYCDKAFAAITDDNAVQMLEVTVNMRRPNQADPVPTKVQFARIAPAMTLVAHLNEHYGNLVTYMRMKGIVPPSSEPRR